MSDSIHPGVAALAAWLRERHAAARDCEDKACAALYERSDEAAYREFMLDRAEIIAALDAGGEEGERGLELVEALPPAMREEAAAALRRFAKGARNALRLDSVFYMSALLYPDEHKKGEPDNMELLLQWLEKQ